MLNIVKKFCFPILLLWPFAKDAGRSSSPRKATGNTAMTAGIRRRGFRNCLQKNRSGRNNGQSHQRAEKLHNVKNKEPMDCSGKKDTQLFEGQKNQAQNAP